MHILHVEKMLFSPSGVTSYVRALSALQRARGHVISTFSCDDSGKRTEFPPFRDFTATSNPLALASMIHNPRASALLDAFLRRSPRVDVAHVHNIYHHLTPSVLTVLARRRIPIVMTVHDYRLVCPTKHFLRPDGVCTRCWPHALFHVASPRCAGLAGVALAIETLVQRFGRRYDRGVEFFICPNPFLAGKLTGVAASASKVVTVPNPVSRLELPADEPRRTNRLAFAGRMAPEKGPDLMLELAEGLRQADVVLAGDGRMLEDLRSQARARHLANVTFTGALDRAALGRLMASATVVVLPSRCLENSPQTLLEAMAAGRAVIVPDYPTLRPWVADRRTGRVFSPGSAESLTAVAADVLANPAEREAVERRAAEWVTRRHNGDAIADKIDQLYREAHRRCALRW